MNVDYLQKLIYTLKGEQKDEKNNFQIQIVGNEFKERRKLEQISE